jgi:hypothetical protein
MKRHVCKDKQEYVMEGLTRRAFAGLAVLSGAAAASAADGASTSDSLDALAKAKGFIGFGSEMDAADLTP